MLRMIERLVFIFVVLRTLRSLKKLGLKAVGKLVVNALMAPAKSIPGVSGLIDVGVQEEVAKIEKSLLGEGDERARTQLPETGVPTKELLAEVKALAEEPTGFDTGKAWGGIYHDTRAEVSELPAIQAAVFAQFNSTNSLYPGVFPAVRKFEAEIIAMAVHILHGDPVGAVGLLTSGGTESVLIAIHGYREQARQQGIEEPEIICSHTAHGALDKACHYFGLNLVKLEADPVNQQLKPQAVQAAITPRTIAVYASAPTFPHGVVDPIQELGLLCKSHELGLHVDNCLGGFWLPFMQKAGRGRKFEWDFKVEGVTSISMDIHKYGFASKGASVVAFRTAALRRLTYCPVRDGTQLYITPTMQGSRSGAVMACAWATMLHMGDQGYTEAAIELDKLHQKVQAAIVERGPTLRLVCPTDLATVPIASDEVDIYALASLMEHKGWNLFTGCKPKCMSLCIGERHKEVLDTLIKDLDECLATLLGDPSIKPSGDAAVYGAADAYPDEIIEDVMKSYVDIKLSVKHKAAPEPAAGGPALDPLDTAFEKRWLDTEKAAGKLGSLGKASQ